MFFVEVRCSEMVEGNSPRPLVLGRVMAPKHYATLNSRPTLLPGRVSHWGPQYYVLKADGLPPYVSFGSRMSAYLTQCAAGASLKESGDGVGGLGLGGRFHNLHGQLQ